jgi:hypothetical protein
MESYASSNSVLPQSYKEHYRFVNEIILVIVVLCLFVTAWSWLGLYLFIKYEDEKWVIISASVSGVLTFIAIVLFFVWLYIRMKYLNK